MKKLLLVTTSMLFCGPLFAGLTVNLEEASYCDPIYTPANCRVRPNAGNQSVKTSLYASTGINLSDSGQSRYIPQTVTVMGTDRLPQVERSSVATVPNLGTAPTTEQLNSGGAPPQASNGNSNGLDFGNNPQAASTQPAVQVTQPNGLTNVNGVLYREEPKKAKIESESETAPGQLGTAINTLPQSGEPGGVKTKSGSGGGDRSPTSAAGAAGSAMAANPYQGYESSPGSGSAGNMAGQLKALAAALGKSVYAALGISEESEGNRSYASLGKNSGNGVNGAILGPDGKPLPKLGKINKNLLKDQFGRYITSSKKMEFGGANELMFQSMCGHYAAYASQNRIPYDRAGCEPANDDKY